MQSSRGSWLAASTTQVLAWAVLLVLSLGLPRLLVVCTGQHCDSQIEFVHESGSCCGHERAKDTPGDDRGDVAREGHGGCVDVALGIGTGPLPQRIACDPASPPCLVPEDLRVPACSCLHAVEVRPPPTGPPRTDQRTELLASTLLLL